ncbi:hypothetical protein NLI96_g7513 [Meripilus lineatus]|uniref:Uncharacterized protein n=1 Tax=Meripilus lineatus TaxID=2056292 RepID=A0AAD5UZ30_9APHY|nr:hypothetical protein NLI96_g7513 [Physisporinus lineatus]
MYATILPVGNVQTCKKPNFTQVREIWEIENQQKPGIPNFAKLKFSPCLKAVRELRDRLAPEPPKRACRQSSLNLSVIAYLCQHTSSPSICTSPPYPGVSKARRWDQDTEDARPQSVSQLPHLTPESTNPSASNVMSSGKTPSLTTSPPLLPRASATKSRSIAAQHPFLCILLLDGGLVEII